MMVNGRQYEGNLKRQLKGTAACVLAVILYLLPVRRAGAEDKFGAKTLYYIEDGQRMRIVAPTVSLERSTDSGLTIKLQGIYNSISGASPTGLPKKIARPRVISSATTDRGTQSASTPPSSPQPTISRSRDDDHGDDRDDDELEEEEAHGSIRTATIRTIGKAATGTLSSRAAGAYHAIGAATPSTPAPSPPPATQPAATAPAAESSPQQSSASNNPPPAPAVTEQAAEEKLPTAQVDDTRIGISFDISKKFGSHTPGVELSYSKESDYESRGVALRDSVEFNKKNTTLTAGAAYTRDILSAVTLDEKMTKESRDLMLGLTQLLDKKTFITVNLTIGDVAGYLADPYKYVELNGEAQQEKRPDSKTKQILFASLTRYFDSLNGSAELSYRIYNDSYGISANTYAFAWYQKIGDLFILRPSIRYYSQTAADFYDVTFTGSPEFYSSDYRISALHDVAAGLKLIWTPTSNFSMDASYERFIMNGNDTVTPAEAYPSANVIMFGVNLCL